jgi:hypothetical protein
LRRLALLTLLIPLAVGALPGTTSAARLGTVKGRVVNAATDEGRRGVRVTLRGGATDDRGGVTEALKRSTVTDAEGWFSFEDLPTGEDRPYFLDARHAGGLFAGDVVTMPGDTRRRPVIESTLRVWPTTTDPNALVIERSDLFVLEGSDGGVDVVESLEVVNLTRRAYILGFGLPSKKRQTPRDFYWNTMKRTAREERRKAAQAGR